MSSISRDPIRAYEATGILDRHRFCPVDGDGLVLMPMVGLSFVGAKIVGAVAQGGYYIGEQIGSYFTDRNVCELNNVCALNSEEPNSWVSIAKTAGFIFTFGACIYFNGPYQRYYEQIGRQILSSYEPYQRLCDKDIAVLLINGNHQVRHEIIQKLDSIQRRSVSKYIRDPQILDLLGPSPQGPRLISSTTDVHLSKNQRSRADEMVLNYFWDSFCAEKLGKNRIVCTEVYRDPLETRLEKCRETFGDRYLNAKLLEFLEKKLDIQNVKAIHDFAKEHNMVNLENTCIVFFDQHEEKMRQQIKREDFFGIGLSL